MSGSSFELQGAVVSSKRGSYKASSRHTVSHRAQQLSTIVVQMLPVQKGQIIGVRAP
jgi:hypothetical protein